MNEQCMCGDDAIDYLLTDYGMVCVICDGVEENDPEMNEAMQGYISERKSRA